MPNVEVQSHSVSCASPLGRRFTTFPWNQLYSFKWYRNGTHADLSDMNPTEATKLILSDYRILDQIIGCVQNIAPHLEVIVQRPDTLSAVDRREIERWLLSILHRTVQQNLQRGKLSTRLLRRPSRKTLASSVDLDSILNGLICLKQYLLECEQQIIDRIVWVNALEVMVERKWREWCRAGSDTEARKDASVGHLLTFELLSCKLSELGMELRDILREYFGTGVSERQLKGSLATVLEDQ